MPSPARQPVASTLGGELVRLRPQVMPEGMRLLSRRGAPEAPATAEGPEPAEARCWQPRPATVAPLLAVLSCVLYCCNGELLQALQTHAAGKDGASSPSTLLNLTLCHLGGLLFAPHFLARDDVASGEAFAAAAAGALASAPRTAALCFAFLIMGYNCAWLSSAKLVSAGLTNAVFQTSIAFVYLTSTRVFAEPLTFPRMVGVGMALAGSGLASGLVHFGADPLGRLSGPTPPGTVMGVMLALLASLGVTVYQVLFRQLFGHLKGDWRFLAYFGAWVSVWHVLAILPMVVLASLLGIEKLVLPSGNAAVAGTLVSAALASAVNALYLCIVMWGSPMLLPCASALSVPLTVALDAVFHGARPTSIECLGHLMVVVSVVLIMDLHSAALTSMGRYWLGTARVGESSPAKPARHGRGAPGRGSPPLEV